METALRFMAKTWLCVRRSQLLVSILHVLYIFEFCSTFKMNGTGLRLQLRQDRDCDE